MTERMGRGVVERVRGWTGDPWPLGYGIRQLRGDLDALLADHARLRKMIVRQGSYDYVVADILAEARAIRAEEEK